VGARPGAKVVFGDGEPILRGGQILCLFGGGWEVRSLVGGGKKERVFRSYLLGVSVRCLVGLEGGMGATEYRG
jgi:hypothetical protein